MANRYWVNGSGNWNDTSHWSTTSGGSGGASVPGSSDTALLQDDGTGTTAVTLVANVTPLHIRVEDDVTFNTANFNITCGTDGSLQADYPNNTLNLGSSTIRVRFFYLSTTTALNAGTSTIQMNGPSNYALMTIPGNHVFYNVTTYSTTYYLWLEGSSYEESASNWTFNNLTHTATHPVQKSYIEIENANLLINGTLTFNAFSQSLRGRLLVDSPYTSTINAAAVSLSNVDFEGILAIGAATPWSGAYLGNGGGNSGISFETAVNKYWIGNGGTYSDPTHWSLSSGGASGGLAPLPQDPVFFDSNSFSSASQLVDFDLKYVGNIDFTGITNNPQFDIQQGSIWFIGNIIFDANFTSTTFQDAFSQMRISGDTDTYIESNGAGVPALYIEKRLGKTFSLADDIIYLDRGDFGLIVIRTGVFDANNKNVGLQYLDYFGYNGADASLLMGSGTWDLNNGQIWFDYLDSPDTFTLNSGTSTITFDVWFDMYLYGPDPFVFYNFICTNTESGEIDNNPGAEVTFNNFTVEINPAETFPWVGFNNSLRLTTESFILHGTAAHLVEFTTYDAVSPMDVTIIDSNYFEVSYLDVHGMYAKGAIPVDASLGSVDSDLNLNWFFGNARLSQNVDLVSGDRYRLSFNLGLAPGTHVVVTQGTKPLITL